MTVTESTTEIDSATDPNDDAVVETEIDVVDDVLVEEISIDGMCGVY